jgi:hypothetical protein
MTKRTASADREAATRVDQGVAADTSPFLLRCGMTTETTPFGMGVVHGVDQRDAAAVCGGDGGMAAFATIHVTVMAGRTTRYHRLVSLVIEDDSPHCPLGEVVERLDESGVGLTPIEACDIRRFFD